MRSNWIRMMVVLALVGTVGCGKKASESAAEKAAEKAIADQTGGSAKVDLSDGKMSIKTDKGTFTADASGGVAVPENFPKDVPVPASSKLVTASSTPEAVLLMMEGPADAAGTVKSFSDEMKAKGWTEETTANMGGQLVASFKKDARTTTITAAPAGDKSSISVTAVLAK